MGKINICRPITFYNNFVPAVSIERIWEYCAFGAFDGVQIHNAILSKKASNILTEILEHQNDFSKKLEGKYTAQTIYAICHDDEQKEKAFWEDDVAKPFIFFCRMQFKDNIDTFCQNKEWLERYLQRYEDITSMVYVSYDNSDLIMVIKTCLYSEGAKIVNGLHQGVNFSFGSERKCELRNSFTVFAVKSKFIASMTCEKQRQSLNEKEKIDLVSIRIIEHDCGKMRKFSTIINGSLKEKRIEFDEIQPILGVDDEILFLRNVGWGDFLYLYHDQEGVFGSDYIAGTTTTICIKIQEDIEETAIENNKSNKVEAVAGAAEISDDMVMAESEEILEIYRGYADSIKKKIQVISEENAKYKELNMILNILPKFSGGVFSDYIFFAILKPLNMLAELLEGGNDDCYYEFIKMFSVYAQNSTKSDRHSMQAMDFNAKLYDIPAKLNAFYTTLIYRASEVLNVAEEEEEAHIYEFFVIPGFTNIICVTELLYKVSENKRLICVEVPENSFYNIGESMVTFMHEAAHYVGTFFRNRKQRYDCFLQSIASAYIEYIKSFWLEEQYEIGVKVTDIEWKALKRRMTRMLWKMLEREKNLKYLQEYQIGEDDNSEEQAKKIQEKNNIYQWHFSFLKQNLYRALMDIVQLALPIVFGGIVFELPRLKQDDVYEFIRDISEKFLTRYTEPTTRMTADTVLEQLVDLYEESFADLMSVLILNLSGKDYLDCVINSSIEQGVELEILKNTNVLYRILLVCDVMFHTRGEGWTETCWNEDNNRESRMKLLSGMWEIRDIIKNGRKGDMLTKRYRTSSFYALLDKGVYTSALDYLKECRRRFESKCTAGHRLEICTELSDFYKEEKSETNNIEQQLNRIEKFIDLYKRNMLEELSEIKML